MCEYTHVLIPNRVDFVPDTADVGAFLASLISIGAAPLNPTIAISKLTGEVQTFTNPFTLELDSRRIWTGECLNEIADTRAKLQGLDDYNVSLNGMGPPALPAFVFDFKDAYAFSVRCCLRAEIVSTSDWHDDFVIGQKKGLSERKVEFFGRPCRPTDRLGLYHNPTNMEIIEVPNAGCARFWVEIEFGKMLFPRIESRLDVIEPKIVEAAEKVFGIGFLQGCHWCA